MDSCIPILKYVHASRQVMVLIACDFCASKHNISTVYAHMNDISDDGWMVCQNCHDHLKYSINIYASHSKLFSS